ncbi:MAG TPA: alkaline phosphatase family protein [Armatimonadota bacterium]|nr:alkaline phosphatase family protein [Armatimonadota bacterium]
MRKLLLALLTLGLLAALCVPAFCFDPSVPAAERNAILFSWDAAQREHVNECLARNELPNLAALIAEGKMVNIDIIGHVTDTKSGHTQMLTGYDPAITGVYGNNRFKAIPEGLTIFERLEKAFGDENIVTIMLTGKDHHIGSALPAAPEVIEEAKEELKALQAQKDSEPKKLEASRQGLNTIILNTDGEPWYLVKHNFDFWDGDKSRIHTAVGRLMISYLHQFGKQRLFAFFHFSDPDHVGHKYGENSSEYNDAIIACDMWLGRAVKKLKDLGVYDKTMIFVTADHGLDEGKTSHNNAPSVFLASDVTSLSKNGDQRDIVPTILTEMGVDISKIQPKYTGTLLTREQD